MIETDSSGDLTPATGSSDERAICARCGDYAGDEGRLEERSGAWICSSCLERLAARREAALPAEASFRRAATTFYLIALFGGAAGLVAAIALFDGALTLGLQILVVSALVVASNVVTGIGIARLRPWAVWPGVVLALPLLPIIPLGTLMASSTIVRLIRHREVTSAEHRELVRLTPDQTPTEVARWQAYVIAALIVGIVGYVVMSLSTS